MVDFVNREIVKCANCGKVSTAMDLEDSMRVQKFKGCPGCGSGDLEKVKLDDFDWADH